MIPLIVAAIGAALWAGHRELIAERAAETERARAAAERHNHHTTPNETALAHRANGLHARIWLGVDR